MTKAQEIRNHRQALLLAAAGALLHNMGKIDSKFLQKQLPSQGQKTPAYHFLHFIGFAQDDWEIRRSEFENINLDSLKDHVVRCCQDEYDEENCQQEVHIQILEAWYQRKQNILSASRKDVSPTLLNTFRKLIALKTPFDDRQYRIGDMTEYLGVEVLVQKREATEKGRKVHRCRLYQPPFPITTVFPSGSRLTHLMNLAHGITSGVEKENIHSQSLSSSARAFRATPFGHEAPAPSDHPDASQNFPDIEKVQESVECVLQAFLHPRPQEPFSYQAFARGLQPYFSQAIADTRRPLNDVTIWNMGAMAAAFLLTQALTLWGRSQQEITHAWLWDAVDGRKLHWRLLEARIDGLGFLDEAATLADVRVRRRRLERALQQVRDYLENLPVAMEIYRDENGSFFLFPDDESLWEALRADVDRRAEIDAGVHLALILSDPLHASVRQRDDAHFIGRYLFHRMTQAPQARARPQRLAEIWGGNARTTPICIACHLRPQGYGAEEIDAYQGNPSFYRKKARSRQLCCHCMHERKGVSERWATQGLAATTPWLSEVADANGRVALVVGRFDIEHFANHLRYPPSQGQEAAPSHSFARLQRVWESARAFWQSILPEDDAFLAGSVAENAVGRRQDRLALLPVDVTMWRDVLGDYHVYELMDGQGRKISVVWDVRKGYLITADSIPYLQNARLARDETVEGWLRGGRFHLREPGGYLKEGADLGEIRFKSIWSLSQAYLPAASILAEPRTFMALVPANKALDLAQGIWEKYEEEMGKVMGRLPLHLGLVFAPAHTPVRVLLDAGRRMLARKPQQEQASWRVQTLAFESPSADDDPPRAEVRLMQDGVEFVWRPHLRMGDRSTLDIWYPYLQRYKKEGEPRRGGDPSPALDYDIPGREDLAWTHVSKLQEGDDVIFIPPTFDFQWLDVGSRRFEIAYDEAGRRLRALARPHLLSSLIHFKEIWEILSAQDGLTSTQIHALADLIETKRATWYRHPAESLGDEAFETWCHSAIVNAAWEKEPSKEQRKKLTTWAVRGLLADAVELYLKALKQRPAREA